MTEFTFVISPVVLIEIISLIKFCIRRYARYKELKLLRETGVQHGMVTKDQVIFKE